MYNVKNYNFQGKIMKTISIAALGGTICMSKDDTADGVKPNVKIEDILNSYKSIQQIAQIRSKNLFSLPSGSLKLENLIEVYKWAKDEIKNGSHAVIVTQGTDTIEESAFFLNLIWDMKEPFILTGAMRDASSLSSDGIGNIYSSIITALSEDSCNRGVLVVLNDTIHSARYVHKSHSFRLDAFISVNANTQGIVAEKKANFFHLPSFRKTFQLGNDKLKNVTILPSYLGDDAKILEFACSDKYDGVVISAFGAGHVSLDMMDKIKKYSKQIPIIISPRVENGISAYKTYGYIGSEIDLQKNGAIMSGWLSALKARILLIVLLSCNYDLDQIRNEFERY